MIPIARTKTTIDAHVILGNTYYEMHSLRSISASHYTHSCKIRNKCAWIDVISMSIYLHCSWVLTTWNQHKLERLHTICVPRGISLQRNLNPDAYKIWSCATYSTSYEQELGATARRNLACGTCGPLECTWTMSWLTHKNRLLNQCSVISVSRWHCYST